VRSTHGVNCTGSCSWKIYVKGGIITWETQQTDYPRTRPDLPNHEPRGCPRGASYSWYIYSAQRLKYPLIRKRLVKLWREARQRPAAGRGLGLDPERSRQAQKLYRDPRAWRFRAFDLGRGERDHRRRQRLYRKDIRAGPGDRLLAHPGHVDGQLCGGIALSVAAGRHLHVLLRLVLRSAARQPDDLGRTDRRSRKRRLVQCRLPDAVGIERAADAHARRPFHDRGALSRCQGGGGQPDYAEATKFADLWLNPKQGTDAALAMAMGHVILREFHLDRQVPYFEDYCRRYSDMPMLVRLVEKDGRFVPDRLLRASDFKGGLGEKNNPEWKTVAIDDLPAASRRADGVRRLPLGRAGQMESRGEGRQGRATSSCA
jgi:nitrate reductase alpha subunit